MRDDRKDLNCAMLKARDAPQVFSEALVLTKFSSFFFLSLATGRVVIKRAKERTCVKH